MQDFLEGLEQLAFGGGPMSYPMCVNATFLVCSPYFSTNISNLGEVSPWDKFVDVHDSSTQVWQTLSVQLEDFSQRVNLQKMS